MNKPSLNPSLLVSVEKRHRRPFNAELNAHGSYSTFQFVLRLSPLVHQTLDRVANGKIVVGNFGFDTAQAFSTLLHETVHWWQHIGSTYGFMLSLMYPGQTHNNHRLLMSLLQKAGFKKDIRSLAASIPETRDPDTISGIANIIVNNHFDFEAFAAFTYDLASAKNVSSKGMFEGEGHAFRMMYSGTLNLLGATFDPQHLHLPNPRDWEAEARELKKRKVPGFYYGSKVGLWPIGARAIFEGQARFAQLQYLAFGSGENLRWEQFRGLGMLDGIYIEAFNAFLKVTGFPQPDRISDRTIALFLLVCDMALNPEAGFPFEMKDLDVIHFVNHPGARFVILCNAIRQRVKWSDVNIRDYSRAEYVTLAEQLGALAGTTPPHQIAEKFSGWATSKEFVSLMDEHKSYEYDRRNMPIRVLFTHLLAFMQDKFEHPEFFCWPGAWMAGERLNDLAPKYFERHGALFIDRENEDGVFPRLLEGIDEQKIQNIFDAFYGACVSYDLTDQWIARPGPFTYNFHWLVGSKPTFQVKEFADRQFAAAYGVNPDDASILDVPAGANFPDSLLR